MHVIATKKIVKVTRARIEQLSTNIPQKFRKYWLILLSFSWHATDDWRLDLSYIPSGKKKHNAPTVKRQNANYKHDWESWIKMGSSTNAFNVAQVPKRRRPNSKLLVINNKMNISNKEKKQMGKTKRKQKTFLEDASQSPSNGVHKYYTIQAIEHPHRGSSGGDRRMGPKHKSISDDIVANFFLEFEQQWLTICGVLVWQQWVEEAHLPVIVQKTPYYDDHHYVYQTMVSTEIQTFHRFVYITRSLQKKEKNRNSGKTH